MRADGTSGVKAFVPTELTPEPSVATGLPVGVATIEKRFEGEVAGRSATLFTAAYDRESGVGTYVATESFEGSPHDRSGAFTFVHSATTADRVRRHRRGRLTTSRKAHRYRLTLYVSNVTLAVIRVLGGAACPSWHSSPPRIQETR